MKFQYPILDVEITILTHIKNSTDANSNRYLNIQICTRRILNCFKFVVRSMILLKLKVYSFRQYFNCKENITVIRTDGALLS